MRASADGSWVSSLGVSMPGVMDPFTSSNAEGEVAVAWIMSSLRSKSTDLESRMVRKLIASIPFDSAGMI